MLGDDLEGWGGQEVGGRSERERMCVHTQLVHSIVQQRLTEPCKAIILKKKLLSWRHSGTYHSMIHYDQHCAEQILNSVNYSEVRTNGNPLQYSCLENPMDGGAW